MSVLDVGAARMAMNLLELRTVLLSVRTIQHTTAQLCILVSAVIIYYYRIIMADVENFLSS